MTAGVAGLVVGLLLAARAGAEAPPAQQQSQAEARQAYLKLIDRPRVDPRVEEKEMDAPGDGLHMWKITYNTEAGQRVPAIVVKPAGAKDGQRLPVVIALHGTSSKKESNLNLLKKIAA
jgi:dipeptidyl aminopeptidase/acylaminoacyl peptidase